jgi:CRP-like cAMP-binding protein
VPTSIPSSQLCENRLLSLLSGEDLQALVPHVEMVDVSFRQVVAERDHLISHIYFPCNSVLSILAQMLDGQTVEVGTVGNEGFYGIDVLVGGKNAIETPICQTPGKALRMPVAAFDKTIDGNTALRRMTQCYVG